MVSLQMTSALTSVRHVNKTDVLTLGSTFGVCSSTYSLFLEVDTASSPALCYIHVRVVKLKSTIQV